MTANAAKNALLSMQALQERELEKVHQLRVVTPLSCASCHFCIAVIAQVHAMADVRVIRGNGVLGPPSPGKTAGERGDSHGASAHSARSRSPRHTASATGRMDVAAGMMPPPQRIQVVEPGSEEDKALTPLLPFFQAVRKLLDRDEAETHAAFFLTETRPGRNAWTSTTSSTAPTTPTSATCRNRKWAS